MSTSTVENINIWFLQMQGFDREHALSVVVSKRNWATRRPTSSSSKGYSCCRADSVVENAHEEPTNDIEAYQLAMVMSRTASEIPKFIFPCASIDDEDLQLCLTKSLKVKTSFTEKIENADNEALDEGLKKSLARSPYSLYASATDDKALEMGLQMSKEYSQPSPRAQRLPTHLLSSFYTAAYNFQGVVPRSPTRFQLTASCSTDNSSVESAASAASEETVKDSIFSSLSEESDLFDQIRVSEIEVDLSTAEEKEKLIEVKVDLETKVITTSEVKTVESNVVTEVKIEKSSTTEKKQEYYSPTSVFDVLDEMLMDSKTPYHSPIKEHFATQTKHNYLLSSVNTHMHTLQDME